MYLGQTIAVDKDNHEQRTNTSLEFETRFQKHRAMGNTIRDNWVTDCRQYRVTEICVHPKLLTKRKMRLIHILHVCIIS